MFFSSGWSTDSGGVKTAKKSVSFSVPFFVQASASGVASASFNFSGRHINAVSSASVYASVMAQLMSIQALDSGCWSYCVPPGGG